MVFNITPLLTREPNQNLGVADIEAWEKIHGRVPRGAFAAEKCLLKQGHWQSEVMANLDQVPASSALIAVSWPKVKRGFGFPARAYAILP